MKSQRSYKDIEGLKCSHKARSCWLESHSHRMVPVFLNFRHCSWSWPLQTDGTYPLWYNWWWLKNLNILLKYNLHKSLRYTTYKGGGLVTKLCLTHDSIDCSPPASSVHGIFQARILEWATLSFSRGSFWPRHQTQVSCIDICVYWKMITKISLSIN